MWLRFALLISLVTPAYAEIATEVSGFAYNTTFTDDSWQAGRSVLAVNVDTMSDVVDVRAQVSTYENSPIRRLTVGRTIHIGNGAHATFQVGRMSRVNSFFNDILDSPASSGFAVLPMAGYNYRMFMGAFTLVDGWKLDVQGSVGQNLLHAHWTHGYMVAPDQMGYQQDVIKKQVVGIQLNSMIGDTLEVHHEYGSFHSYISRTLYGATTELTGTSTTAKYYATNAAVALYDLNKYGIRYDDDEWMVMTEYSVGFSHTYGNTGKRTSITDAWDSSFTVGKYLDNGWMIYTGQSIGENLTAKTQAKDLYTGLTKRFDHLTISAAYHEGHGQGWMNYNMPAPYDWKSWVVSTTYQF